MRPIPPARNCNGASLRVVPREPSARHGATTIDGTILRSNGPTPFEGQRDWWQVATIMLVVATLAPIFALLWLARAAMRSGLALAGVRLGAGRGLFAEILTFQVIGNVMGPPAQVPVYDYVIDVGAGRLVHARQQGEFIEGRIFDGNRVRLSGQFAGGSLNIQGGYNHTLRTRLSLPSSPWRSTFVTLLAMLGLGLVFLAFWAPTVVVPR